MFKILNNNKPTIIAIVGNSGTGKTTISQMLKKMDIFPSIVSYTTRPMRNDETDGIDHYFVSEDEIPKRNEMLAYTYFANNHYWASLKDIEDNKDQPIIYIIDERGLLDLFELERNNKINVIWVQISRNDDLLEIDNDRKNRDIEREQYFYKLQHLGYGPHILIKNNSNIESVAFKTAYRIMEFIKNSGKDIMPEDEYKFQMLITKTNEIINREKNK